MSSSDRESCVLYHGPSAQGRASAAAAAWGRVVGVFGDPGSGLNAETMRAASAVMSGVALGDVPGAVVVGPVDVLTQEGVIDALLKALEEADDRMPKPFLWAWDVGSVRPTVRSRCLTEWCPGPDVVSRGGRKAAKEVVDAVLSGSTLGVLEGVLELGKDDEGDDASKWTDVGEDFLRACALDLARRGDGPHLALWATMRDLYVRRDLPTQAEVLSRLLP